MTLHLSEAQRQALRASEDEVPIRILDPSTNMGYALIRDEQFEKIRSLFETQKFPPKGKALTPLTAEQQQAVRQATDAAVVRLLDPDTQVSYVLLRLDLYEQVSALFEVDDYDLSDTYAAQMESAMRAGWDDPDMDVYNDYDAQRK
jgi:hypothetical protein